MKFKAPILLFVAMMIFSGCTLSRPINEIPMYGGDLTSLPNGIKKANDLYIAKMISEHGSREIAAVEVSKIAWRYYYQQDYPTSMKRFNQVWLLDPNNAHSYWGFGLNLYQEEKYEENIVMNLPQISGHLRKPCVYGQQEVFLCQRESEKTTVENSSWRRSG